MKGKKNAKRREHREEEREELGEDRAAGLSEWDSYVAFADIGGETVVFRTRTSRRKRKLSTGLSDITWAEYVYGVEEED